MSSPSTRKTFLAKIGGIAAAAGLMPRTVARVGAARAETATAAPVAVRAETRAVARRPESL